MPDTASILTQLDKLRASVQDLALPDRERYEPSCAVGQVVTRERKRQKLTQKQLADLAEISTLTVQKIESGRSNTSFATVERVLSVLGKSLWIK